MQGFSKFAGKSLLVVLLVISVKSFAGDEKKIIRR